MRQLERQVLRPIPWQALRQGAKDFSQRHQIALLCAGYLGLVREFGYQVALLPSGLLMREQFFTLAAWRSDMPLRSQMVLAGEGPQEYDETRRSYWSEPFRFVVDRSSIVMVLRNVSVLLPMSRDPTIPVARVLRYAPPAYKLKPDLTSAFD